MYINILQYILIRIIISDMTSTGLGIRGGGDSRVVLQLHNIIFKLIRYIKQITFVSRSIGPLVTL